MVFLRRTVLLRYLLLLAVLLFISSFWLPQGGVGDCGTVWQPCLSFYRKTPQPPLVHDGWVDPVGLPPLIKECPGQSFQAWHLLLYLKSSLSDDDDILLEPYLQSWDQLLNFMDSLGTMVSFFSQKVEEKVVLIRELSLKHSAEAHRKRGPVEHSRLQTPASFGLKDGAYRSVRSMVEMELKTGLVDFSRRTDSGCRTLLRLHRSLLWLKLMLEGLAEGPDADGQYKKPGELSREAYRVALAPHHPWMLRQAAELVFLALPDRQYFLQLVCVQNQHEAAPVLRIIIHALTLVHTRTQRILAEHGMLELP
ncbi:Ceramide-1-phosphate transfer protein Glycolipid transfer protein domain-containing protein 1 [Channa argus]|uniref:Ceramide-1-phosphate transfer protein Glycolipid transfer protein domain-containing protein 1 n=1 Tax=Channa argus TaxID=215402 RepID=A0A6G1Q6Y5_CHAAH|nr:Ceramide-1-phosphate transfer protein Glycolipid transfer protein domain-containing protein 1 [Channa argus]